MRRQSLRICGLTGLALLALAALPFVIHSLDRGSRGLAGDAAACERLCWPDFPAATVSIFVHMVLGGAITLLVLLQLVAPIRRRWPALHRWTGRATVRLALATAAGGFIYMAGVGTVGGPVMTAGFTLYGGLLAVSAAMAFKAARARDYARHRRCGLRLVVLALGSWLYRVPYTVWYLATGGAATKQNFSGLFDQIQIFAFYLPYLFLQELYLRHRPAAATA
jgi:hypothetical protein